MRALTSRISGLSTCILFLGLAGCEELSEPDVPSGGVGFAAAETETTVEVAVQDFTEGNPCVGEEIHWTGTVRIIRHETSNRGAPPPSDPGSQHFIEVQTAQLIGTGLSSGESYRLNSLSIRPLQSPDPQAAFPTVDKYSGLGRLIGPTGAIALLEFSFNVVTTATGEIVVDEFQFEVVCL